MGKSPAFQFYPKDYMADEHVQLMSLDQEGAYLRLLCHQWLEGSVPDDVAALARICRVPTAKMARLWPGVRPCFEEREGGRLVNPRMARDREEREAFRSERAAAGRKGARVRHGSATSSANGSAIDLPLANDSPPTSNLQPPISNSLQTGATAEQRARWLLDSEALRLSKAIADHPLFQATPLWEGKPVEADATSVMRRATTDPRTGYGGVVNPASCKSADRLRHAVERMREWLQVLREAGGGGDAGGRRGEMPWERAEREAREAEAAKGGSA